METAGLRQRLRNDISSGNSQEETSASPYHKKKKEKKPQHGLQLPSPFSLPYSKLKPYAPSRISKIDLYIFNRAVWREKVGLMSLIGAENQHTGLRQHISKLLPETESGSNFSIR